MVEEFAAPPLRWLAGSADQRRAFWRFWLHDTAIGLLDTGIHHGMRPMPIDVCSRLGCSMGLFARLRYPASDARARAAWRLLRPAEAGAAETDRAIDNLWRCVGRSMAEFSVLDRLWPAGRITVEGIDNVAAAQAAGRPRLIMALHTGNWETIGVTLVAAGHTAVGFYLPPDNRFDHRIAVGARRRYGAVLVPPSPAATQRAARELKDGGLFVIYVDEFIRGRVQAPAFGRPPAVAGSNIAYVARLAAMTGADVIPAYCVRHGDTAWFTVRFLPPVEVRCTADKRADAAVNVDRLDAVIAPILRAHFDQWLYGLDLDLGREGITEPAQTGSC